MTVYETGNNPLGMYEKIDDATDNKEQELFKKIQQLIPGLSLQLLHFISTKNFFSIKYFPVESPDE